MGRVVHGRIPLFAVARVAGLTGAEGALLGLRMGRRRSSFREPGRGLRETLQHVLHPQHGDDHHPANTVPPPFVRDPAGDAYQAWLYGQAHGRVREERLAAAREAVTTSPHTWEDLRGDGVREWVESTLDNDAALEEALTDLGDLEAEDRPYFGKFLAEMISENLVEAEADYWRSFYGLSRLRHS